MRQEDIAIALEIGVDTLRKYFQAELSVGAHQRRMEVLNGLYQAAKRGSSAAAKAYLAVNPELAVPPLPSDVQATPSAPPATPTAPAGDPPPKLGAPKGKKEQAQADAKVVQAGTHWEDLLPGAPLQ